MTRNLTRFDLSDRLIHFTRRIDLLRDGAGVPELPTEWGMSVVVEEDVLTPFFLLRRMVRMRQIVSTRSYRGHRPTIYGPDPAVCFTEMPLAAFLRASRDRNAHGEYVSPYALLVKKDDAFAAGARPAIYSLSSDVYAYDRDDGTRWLPVDRLAAAEQFRFVAFDPRKGGRLDWTHEREWRWPNRRSTGFLDYDIPDDDDPRNAEWRDWSNRRERDRAEEDGLCLDKFTEVAILVRTTRQANLIRRDVLWLADAGVTRNDLYSFILTGEGLDPDTLIDPARTSAAIDAAAIDLAPYFEPTEQDSDLVSCFTSLVESVVASTAVNEAPDEYGGCWLWLMDNTHPLTRALLRDDRLLISETLPRYLVKMHYDDSLSLSARETLTKAVAERVRAEFGIDATYYSVLNSHEIDALPSYTNVFELDERYLNYAHDERDM